MLNLQFNTISAILSMYSLLMIEGALVGLALTVVIGASASSLLGVWMCMEANMLMFSAILSFSKTSDEPQALKYFLIQSIGSAAMVAWVFSLPEISVGVSMMLIYTSMVLKLGLAPLHSWFISLASNISWTNLALFSTLQKILPLSILSQMHSSPMAVTFVVLSAVIGIAGSMGQMEVKKLLAYSSVFNGAWMVSVSYQAAVLWGFLLFYSVSFLACVITLRMDSGPKQLSSWANSSPMAVMLLLAFLSLGGVPPMVGFYAKLLAVLSLVGVFDFAMVILLVASSVILTYVYIRLIYSSLSFMAVGMTSPLKINFSAIGAVLVAPSLAMFCILCEGVCTGNFGFPGLI